MNRNLKLRIHASLPGVKKIISLAVTESTHDVARELAMSGEREGTLIIAKTQTCGKGRHGRSWESPPGGLYMTIILSPRIHFCSLAGLSLLASKTVAGTLNKIYGIKTTIKPPNDVLAWHPKRRKYLKVSGVLTESSSAGDKPEWVLLGVGVNLENTLPENLDKAASVRQILGLPARSPCEQGSHCAFPDFLKSFFEIFWKRYSEWETGAVSKS